MCDSCCRCCQTGSADVVTICGDTFCPKPPCPIPRCDCACAPPCCRKGWDISQSLGSRFLDFSAFPLAPLSKKYKCWLQNFGPKTDSNLYASLYSSRVAAAGYNMVPVDLPPECGSKSPCPCHFSYGHEHRLRNTLLKKDYRHERRTMKQIGLSYRPFHD